jgi:hypothetical protein
MCGSGSSKINTTTEQWALGGMEQKALSPVEFTVTACHVLRGSGSSEINVTEWGTILPMDGNDTVIHQCVSVTTQNNISMRIQIVLSILSRSALQTIVTPWKSCTQVPEVVNYQALKREKGVWRIYVTMKLNKIDIDSLPVEVRHIHKEYTKAFFLNLPNQEGVAFINQKRAREALYWWIICKVPLVNSRRSWANELLGEYNSVELVVSTYSRAWCTLTRGSTGSFCIKYNG